MTIRSADPEWPSSGFPGKACPTPALVAEIFTVLGPHNRREEEPGGVYDACDEALGPAKAERLVQELRGFPEVPLKAYNDGPAVLAHRGDRELARRQWLDEEEGR